MSGVILSAKAFFRTYGCALVLALLLHALLLVAVLQTRFTPVAKPSAAKPIVSYLYQPPAPEISADTTPAAATTAPASANVTTPAQRIDNSTAVGPKPLADIADETPKQQTEQVAPAPQQSLAQRALSRAATVDPVTIEQTAAASYQQFLQAQQQPKMTVEKRHQQLSTDPALQVFAQLDNGLQLIRVKGGCRFADPSKEGFDALMAANAVVPCGDEAKTSDLLKQALEKHSKR
ncbi:hypothetical protein [Rheinheimera maricola]|uniref:Energy transducer TonB n=1 Tax=Rheinheimera maricola TaxID=2793282 RepID=A0ABS7XF62_9GAMM|nr:hypothetical protein [Rheinheimera maricola]MBZ9613790.1 hypothetical protein [Rheinheimera maricola]